MSTLCNLNVCITAPDGPEVLPDANDLASSRQEAFAVLERFFGRLACGMEPGFPGETKVVIIKGTTQAAAVRAFATLTFTGASGTVGGTIAGTAKTVAHSTDAADAAAVAAAINADATLNKIVVAEAVGTVCTITAIQPGVLGNQITVAASGTGVAAGNVSGGKMQSGVGCDGSPVTVAF